MVRKKKSYEGISPELREKLKDVQSKVERPTQIRRIKRLQELQDKLEHSHKIKSLKDIEKKVIYPQIIGIIFLFPVILYLSGASLKPFHSPLVFPLLMAFIWILIIAFEGFAFRLLEIKHHPSKSSKCIMSKNSLQRAIPIMIIALIIFPLLYTPYLAEEIEARTSIEDSLELERSSEEIILVSKGRFGFRVAKNLTVHCEIGEVNISLYEKETGLSFFDRSLEAGESHFYTDFSKDDFSELVLRFNSSRSYSRVRYEFDMEIHDKSRSAFASVAFVYLAAFTEWTAVLYPIKKKYSGVGIYH